MSSNRALLFVLQIVIAISRCTCKYVQKRETLMFGNVHMHPSCQNRDYCFEVDDTVYPHKLVDTLLKGVKLHNIDTGSTEDRYGQDHSIVTPCKFNNTIEPLYQIKDAENRVRWVVQSKHKNFEQRIRIEFCLNKGKLTHDALPLDLGQLSRNSKEAFCEESYLNYRILVVSLDGKRIESVQVGPESIPVCCKCIIKNK